MSHTSASRGGRGHCYAYCTCHAAGDFSGGCVKHPSLFCSCMNALQATRGRPVGRLRAPYWANVVAAATARLWRMTQRSSTSRSKDVKEAALAPWVRLSRRFHRTTAESASCSSSFLLLSSSVMAFAAVLQQQPEGTVCFCYSPEGAQPPWPRRLKYVHCMNCCVSKRKRMLHTKFKPREKHLLHDMYRMHNHVTRSAAPSRVQKNTFHHTASHS